MTSHADKSTLLQHAGYALGLLDCRIQENAFGEVEGIDTLHIGLDSLAAALAPLVEFPDADETPALEDILAYLAAHGRISSSAREGTIFLREGIKSATYTGLSSQNMRELNDVLDELYRALGKLLSELQEGEDD